MPRSRRKILCLEEKVEGQPWLWGGEEWGGDREGIVLLVWALLDPYASGSYS